MLPWLKRWVELDDNYAVRRAAIQEPARGWKEASWLFEFLCDRATNDIFNREYSFQPSPRQTAIKELVTQFADRPETLRPRPFSAIVPPTIPTNG